MANPVNDPLYADQWHLHNAGQNGGTPGIDLDLGNIWSEYSGKGVTVGVFDEGIPFTHPDLEANVDPSISLSTQPTGDGQPQQLNETHGAEVAGIIAGVTNNGIGVAGIAPDARLASVYLNLGNSPANGPNDVARGYKQAAAFYDICNNSWGASGFVNFNTEEMRDEAEAIAQAATLGRRGLGTVIVWSGGNDRVKGADANMENYISSPYTIGVAAIDFHGKVSSYSNPGDDLLISGPSNNLVYDWVPDQLEQQEEASADPVPIEDHGEDPVVAAGGGEGETGGRTVQTNAVAASGAIPTGFEIIKDFSGVVTTTNIGQGVTDRGKPGGDYTKDFGGTSAAGPMVAGVIALMLQANPNLGYRDVQDILADTARNTDINADWTINGAKDWNGGGMHVSRDAGFGLVDAHAAVRLAETWTGQNTAANAVTVDSGIQNVDAPILLGASPLTSTVHIAQDEDIERAEVVLRIANDSSKDLKITLTSPSGTVSTLLNPDQDYPFPNTPFSVTSTHFLGEGATGDWTLQVQDTFGGDAYQDSRLVSWELILHGKDASADNDHIYTEEYPYYASKDPKRTVLHDTSDNPVLNTAAIRSNSSIDLHPGATSSLGKAPLTIGADTTVTTLYAGDGNDTIVCNDADDTVSGGRGDDTIVAGSGRDVILGGPGNDTLVAGGGSDILDGGTGWNTVKLDCNFEDARFFRAGNDQAVLTPQGIDILRHDQVLAFTNCATTTGSLLFGYNPEANALLAQG